MNDSVNHISINDDDDDDSIWHWKNDKFKVIIAWKIFIYAYWVYTKTTTSMTIMMSILISDKENESFLNTIYVRFNVLFSYLFLNFISHFNFFFFSYTFNQQSKKFHLKTFYFCNVYVPIYSKLFFLASNLSVIFSNTFKSHWGRKFKQQQIKNNIYNFIIWKDSNNLR